MYELCAKYNGDWALKTIFEKKYFLHLFGIIFRGYATCFLSYLISSTRKKQGQEIMDHIICKSKIHGTQGHIFIRRTVESSTAPELDSLKLYILYEEASLTLQFTATKYQ